MKKPFMFLAVTLVLALAVGACGTTATDEPAPPPPPPAAEEPAEEEAAEEEAVEEEMSLEGETVTIFSACGEEQCKVFEENFADFEAKTGIDVVVEGSGDFEQLSVVRAEAGDPPDFFNFPQPGLMADMARDGFLVDYYSFLSQDDVSAGFTDAWVSSGLVDGELVGLWHGVDVKSLVWYPKQDFEDLGLAIPETWDELLALTDELVGMGVTPWCIGIESGSATGWVVTDWIEDIMLRTTSPENYDAWTRGELAFSSPEVKNAFEMAGEIFFNPDYVLGGTTGILTTAFGDSPTGLFDPRSCYLHRQASFIPSFFPEGVEVGVDVDGVDGIELGDVDQIDPHQLIFLDGDRVPHEMKAHGVDGIDLVVPVEVGVEAVHHHHQLLGRGPGRGGVDDEDPVEPLVDVGLEGGGVTVV